MLFPFGLIDRRKAMIYNCYGERLESEIPELQDGSFGTIDSTGKVTIYWDEESDVVDVYGFDKENVEPNGEYTMDVELPVGTILIRYGNPNGKMTAPLGTPFELLGLPYKKETIQFHQYVVKADGVNVKCVVRRGKVREMFLSPGGAIQYMHPQSILDEIRTGKIAEDFSWMKQRVENA